MDIDNQILLKSSFRPTTWIKVAICGLFILGLYYSTFTNLISQWARADYSYCYLMPFVIAYLVWDKRKRLKELPSRPSWAGLFPLSLGLVFFWLGELGGEYFTLYMSFWLVVVGLCWLHMGWQKIKAISFALIMVLTMFPLPYFVYNKCSVKLQLISTKLGVGMMQFYGTPASYEGNVIDLGFAHLQVVEACSGLRYLFALIVLGLLVAYFFKAAFWKRAILVISTVPIGIIANSLRIATTGILYDVWSPRVAEGFLHVFSGWFIFMLSLIVLTFEMWLLSKIKFKDKLSLKGNGLFDPEPNEETSEVAHGRSISSRAQFVVSIILIGATISLSQFIEFREEIPIPKPLSQFPLRLGLWNGAHVPMDQRFVDALDLSDYVVIDYKDPEGKSVNFYVAYYQSQRKGESIHTPATCLLGSGWTFGEQGATTVPTPRYLGDSIKVNRILMEKWDQRLLCYYWFLQRGRILTNVYQLKIFNFLEALTRQRTDGALVRLITPVYEIEGLHEADERLIKFTQKIMPVLTEFIPGRKINSKQ